MIAVSWIKSKTLLNMLIITNLSLNNVLRLFITFLLDKLCNNIMRVKIK